MIGVNPINSTEEIPSDVIIGLCDGLLTKMEEPAMRRMRNADTDQYYRSLKTQFKRLDDRYPGIFLMLTQYGRQLPQGGDPMDRIKEMLQLRDKIHAGEDRLPIDKVVDYKYAKEFVSKVLPPGKFDEIVKPPEEREDAPVQQPSKGSGLDGIPVIKK